MLIVSNSSGNFITTTKTKRKRKSRKRTSPYLFAIILLFIGIAFLLLFSPFFSIQYIKVEGNEKLETEAIINIASIERGLNIFRINIPKIKRNITSNSYVDSVIIKRKFPNTILITIEERKPIAYIPFMGSNICIDKEGNVLEVVSDLKEEEKKLPIITGLTFTQFKLGEPIDIGETEKFNTIIASIKEIINNDLLAEVSQINMQDKDNIQMTIRDQFEVLLGDSQNLNYKINFLREILNNLNDHEKGIIDLSNEERVIFTPNT